MIFPETPTNIEAIELASHRRHLRLAILTTLVPVSTLVLFFFLSGQAFWLAPIVLFFLVGGLNYYLMESRPVPRKLRLDSTGIRIETRQGLVHQHTWSNVREIKEDLRALGGRHRMEVYFKDDSDPLYLYPHAMLLTTCDGQPVEPLLSDKVRMTGVIWDRPVKYARVILAKHVEGFKPKTSGLFGGSQSG
jgi:hypothetical protein